MVQRLNKATRMLQVSGLICVLIFCGLTVAYNLMPEPYNESNDDDGPDPMIGFEIDPEYDFPSQRPPIAEQPKITKPLKEEDLLKQPAKVQRAMRANVRLDAETRGQSAMGSGIIMRIDDATAYVLTNRHVVDMVYASTSQLGANRQATPLKLMPPIFVSYIDDGREPGKVIWVADDNVDRARDLSNKSNRRGGLERGCRHHSRRIRPRHRQPRRAGLDVDAWSRQRASHKRIWLARSANHSNRRHHQSGQQRWRALQRKGLTHRHQQFHHQSASRKQHGFRLKHHINPQVASNTGFALNISLLGELDPESIRPNAE